MAKSEALELRQKAGSLGIEGYRRMSVAELRSAIENADGATVTKVSSNGPRSKRKSAAVVKRVVGRKSRKSQPAASPAKRGKAKRATAATPKRKTATRKTAVRKPAAKVTKPVTKPEGEYGRNLIDGSNVDWTAEWGGGKTGNRAIILRALRRFKGDRKRTLAHLVDKAQTMYPKDTRGKKRSKQSARNLLSWHISRVAFDFVMATSQHAVSEINANVKAARKRNGKATGASEKPAKREGTRKSTRRAAAPQKRSQAARATAKRTTRKRSPVAAAAGRRSNAKRVTAKRATGRKRAGAKATPLKRKPHITRMKRTPRKSR